MARSAGKLRRSEFDRRQNIPVCPPWSSERYPRPVKITYGTAVVFGMCACVRLVAVMRVLWISARLIPPLSSPTTLSRLLSLTPSTPLFWRRVCLVDLAIASAYAQPTTFKGVQAHCIVTCGRRDSIPGSTTERAEHSSARNALRLEWARPMDSMSPTWVGVGGDRSCRSPTSYAAFANESCGQGHTRLPSSWTPSPSPSTMPS